VFLFQGAVFFFSGGKSAHPHNCMRAVGFLVLMYVYTHKGDGKFLEKSQGLVMSHSKRISVVHYYPISMMEK
jgi:hypothetical protein